MQVKENRAAVKTAALRKNLFFMFGILLCFIRLRAKLARSGNDGIAEKLSRCNTSTLLTVNQMLDLLLKQQEMNDLERKL